MALKPNFAVQLSNKRRLAEIARSLGFVQKRGQKGEGNVRAMLEAIIAGEALVQVQPRVKSSLTALQVNELMLNQLQARGKLAQRAAQPGRWSRHTPIKVKGEPVSEMLIRERR